MLTIHTVHTRTHTYILAHFHRLVPKIEHVPVFLGGYRSPATSHPDAPSLILIIRKLQLPRNGSNDNFSPGGAVAVAVAAIACRQTKPNDRHTH